MRKRQGTRKGRSECRLLASAGSYETPASIRDNRRSRECGAASCQGPEGWAELKPQFLQRRGTKKGSLRPTGNGSAPLSMVFGAIQRPYLRGPWKS
jgi:hypothetical protein